MRKTTILMGLLILMVGCATVRPIFIPTRAIEYFSYPPRYEVIFNREEVLLFVFNDNTCVSFSSYEKKRVSLSIYFMEAIIKELNKDYKDIKLIIHNHFERNHFSSSDAWFLHCARLRGYMGSFQLYFVPEDRIILEAK